MVPRVWWGVPWFKRFQHDKQVLVIDSFFSWYFIYIKNVTKEKKKLLG
jgi:hypothetical protein